MATSAMCRMAINLPRTRREVRAAWRGKQALDRGGPNVGTMAALMAARAAKLEVAGIVWDTHIGSAAAVNW